MTRLVPWPSSATLRVPELVAPCARSIPDTDQSARKKSRSARVAAKSVERWRMLKPDSAAAVAAQFLCNPSFTLGIPCGDTRHTIINAQNCKRYTNGQAALDEQVSY